MKLYTIRILIAMIIYVISPWITDENASVNIGIAN